MPRKKECPRFIPREKEPMPEATSESSARLGGPTTAEIMEALVLDREAKQAQLDAELERCDRYRAALGRIRDSKFVLGWHDAVVKIAVEALRDA